MPVANIIPFPT